MGIVHLVRNGSVPGRQLPASVISTGTRLAAWPGVLGATDVGGTSFGIRADFPSVAHGRLFRVLAR
eukprot:2096291-Pyramimonas_sp.AAC.1